MSHLIHAIVYVLPTLTANIAAIADFGRAYTRRRGYEFLTVSRDWNEVEWLLGTHRAQTVVFAHPEWAAELVGATTGPIGIEPTRPAPAIGTCSVPTRPAPARAVVLVPPGRLDPHGARCAQRADQLGLEIAGVVQTLDAAIKMLHDREAQVLLVADEDHMRDPDGLRIEIVSLQPAAPGVRRSKLIRRQ